MIRFFEHTLPSGGLMMTWIITKSNNHNDFYFLSSNVFTIRLNRSTEESIHYKKSKLASERNIQDLIINLFERKISDITVNK